MAGNWVVLDRRGSRHRAIYWLIGVSLVVALAVIGEPHVSLRRQINSSRRDIANGKSALAVKDLESAIRSAPNNAEAHYLLAVAERRSGNLDHVSGPLQRAAQLGWPKPDLDRQSLLVIAQSGDTDAVEARLKLIMAQGVSDEVAEEIYEALAIGFLKTYRLKEAWECLSFWSAWQPQGIRAISRVGGAC